MNPRPTYPTCQRGGALSNLNLYLFLGEKEIKRLGLLVEIMGHGDGDTYWVLGLVGDWGIGNSMVYLIIYHYYY